MACMCVHAGHAPLSDAMKCVLSLTLAPLDRSWIPDRQTKGTAQLGLGDGMMEALGTRAGTLGRTRYRAVLKNIVHACVCIHVYNNADKLTARHGLCSAFVRTCNAIICIAIVCSVLSLCGCLCIIILLLLYAVIFIVAVCKGNN